MLNRIPNHIQNLFSRILKMVGKPTKATNFILRDGENTLRVIFDKNKKLLPPNTTSNAKFLTRHKNQQDGEESIIFLFFSKEKLQASPRHQGILIHELMHYYDFDYRMFFDKKYINQMWKTLKKAYETKDMATYKTVARQGKHEERARRVQKLFFLKEKRSQ